MTHNNVLSVFKTKFGDISSQVISWFPSGKDCVRIRMANRNELIFTYHNEKDWCLESMNSYISKMKGRI